MKHTLTLCAVLALAACGGEEAGGAAEPSSSHQERGATDETRREGEASATDEPTGGRAEAIARAEAFVRAQGYTDRPPTVSGDDVVREGIEGSLEDRRGMLDPSALRAARAEDGTWMVTFRYADPELAGRGRMLMMPPDSHPRFVHQDRLLE